MWNRKKKIKHAKVTEIHWNSIGDVWWVRIESKNKHGWAGLPGPDMKVNDTDWLEIKKPKNTPQSVILKIAYELLNN